ncbi:ABC transporter substrate-binding protein [Sulfurimonas aquatica]|uniref:ABC transporter substrate-binding protein n=1 Tax=Sulfurimonas aquatica TaxID=2672570 RepID=A0A975GD17_9BACT|nr:ABC transporter substrate-binding protein [Sulfurimonas aquatica]QSZ41888.1 ABC transporter substrate-binding protein [Sulfurimonas aquatica]
MLKRLLLICTVLLFTQNLAANDQTDLKNHFLKMIDEVTLIIGDNSLNKSIRNKKIIDVLTPTFDFELMAKLSLGKSWKKLNSQDKQQFVELYVKRMEKSYSSKIDVYSGEKVEIKKIEQAKRNRIALVTDLISNDENLEIVYKFHKPKEKIKGKDKWLIYDVEILGVSILKTDKAQFREYLKEHGISGLLTKLEQTL